MKYPLDSYPYPQDPGSQSLTSAIADGAYAFVQDVNGVIMVVADGSHVHPKILGGARPAMYAGDLTIVSGKVVDVTNLSGTFQFDDEDGLRAVASAMRNLGLTVEIGAVRFFPPDGSRPVILE
ncbi:MAG TPA: hypothetical protein VFE62_11815 [Gemmataceae bacterium]|nr:hypothetical protein [Gemmataceae bacterium]